MLRPATANELVLGGVWYRSEGGGKFSTVIMVKPKNDAERKLISQWSKEGRIYLRKDRPNYPVTPGIDFATTLRIESYQNK